jgi:hypothetical protein
MYEFFYDEPQMDIPLPLISKDLKLDDYEQRSLGDAPVKQPYFIRKTKIPKIDFSVCTRRIDLWMKDAYLPWMIKKR